MLDFIASRFAQQENEEKKLQFFLKLSGLTRSTSKEAFDKAVLDELEAIARIEDATLREERRESFQHRLDWLTAGTKVHELSKLDPIVDCDRIYHSLHRNFRIESRVLELLAINRIAQSNAQSLFIRSTGESENNGVVRFFDTYSLFANYFEWGEHSKRGRAVIDRMNTIHGRYFIHNDSMKYILLNSCFTWLEGASRIGHRPLIEIEKLGFFHAHIRMGQAMNIAELSHDYEAMLEWFNGWNEEHRASSTLKAETFRTIVDRSLPTGEKFAALRGGLMLAAQVAMDDNYREAVALEAPHPNLVKQVRSFFGTLGTLAEHGVQTVFLRSLEKNAAHPEGNPVPSSLGVSERSPKLPIIDANKENGGHPQGMKPLRTMPTGTIENLPVYTRDEVAMHASREDLWVIIEGEVFDLSSFVALHPGGYEVLQSVAGKDASLAFARANHSQETQIFRLNYRIGRLAHDAMQGAMEEAVQDAIR